MTTDRPVAGALLEVDSLQLGPIQTNCYVVRELGSSRAVVVDPGAEPARVLAHLAEAGLELDAILVTHCHWDHIGAVAGLVEATGAPVWMSATETPALEHPEQFSMPGMPQVPPATVDHQLEGGERIELAGIALDVLTAPGHSPGHLVFLAEGVQDASGDGYEQPPVAFVGDVVFRGSVGRTDLPFADGDTLMASIDRLVARLHPDTVLLSGHGGPTTMAAELATNPFLRRA
ncbi:MAG: fold metallo-hydrolase [Thermoleophilia bacterium]|nr:fold metallo-hydrolase [Thermoleophilia bacterium]